MHTRIFGREVGQSAVLIALLMVAMIAFLGLLLDGGGAYANRRRSQDASDSAAFAGVRALALGSTEQTIWDNITDYATANGILARTDVVASFIDPNGNPLPLGNPCRIGNCGGVPSSATGVWVTTTLQLQPYFISVVIGNAPIPIRSSAKAQTGNPTQSSLLMPMTVQYPCSPYNPSNPYACSALTYGTTYTLTGNSQMQWIDYSNTSGTTANALDVADYLTLYSTSGAVMADPNDTYYNASNPTQYNTPPPSPNPWIPTGPGVKPDACIKAALDAWLNLSLWGTSQSCSGSLSWGSQPANNTWIIPIYDATNGLTGGYVKFHVVMFGEFQLLGYWFAQNQCNWQGAPSNPNCDPNKGWVGPASGQLESCANTGTKCVMGLYLKTVVNLPTTPGSCNTNGVNVCGFGLTQ